MILLMMMMSRKVTMMRRIFFFFMIVIVCFRVIPFRLELAFSEAAIYFEDAHGGRVW